ARVAANPRAGGHIEELQLAVAAGQDKDLAVRRPPRAADTSPVKPLDLVQFLARSGVPFHHHPVVVGRDGFRLLLVPGNVLGIDPAAIQFGAVAPEQQQVAMSWEMVFPEAWGSRGNVYHPNAVCRADGCYGQHLAVGEKTSW